MADQYLAKKAAAEVAQNALPPKATMSCEMRDMVTGNDPNQDASSDDFWLPEDWQEDWDERAAIMEHDGGLPAEQAESEAAISVVRVKHPHGDLAAGWLREMRDIRRGMVPEWKTWSAHAGLTGPARCSKWPLMATT